MNRCIQCYRCVRFYIDYAGGRDLDVFGWHDRVYFGRHGDGVLQSKFSGNLVEVCPTGVFTDKTFRHHYTRKWDLQTAPSICVHCGLGCNTIPGERYGTLRRIRNRYNADVNGYFLCDRGRFGYGFVNSPARVKTPMIRTADGPFIPMSRQTMLQGIGRLLKTERVIGIGSPRASLESNYALRRLVGPENFYLGMADAETRLISSVIRILRQGPVPSASLSEVGQADAVLVLGEDVSNVAPMLDLALRRSILRKPSAIARDLHIALWNDAAVRAALQTERGPLFIATTHGTDLDAAATQAYHAAPQDIARLGFAVANKVDRGYAARFRVWPRRWSLWRREDRRPVARCRASAGPLGDQLRERGGHRSGGRRRVRSAPQEAQHADLLHRALVQQHGAGAHRRQAHRVRHRGPEVRSIRPRSSFWRTTSIATSILPRRTSCCMPPITS